MDDDWDLNAVVRGFTATRSTTVNASNNNYFPSISSSFPNNYNDENHSFDFPNLVDNRSIDSFHPGLHEVYQALCVDPPPATHVASAMTQVYQPQYDPTLTMHPPPPQMNVQMQENVPFNNMMMVAPPMVSFPVTNSQPIRPRRRKSQQAKMVHQVTEEELAADAWAWRKYGQKRIKGSPYPRNYYRCSTAKGCAARKHVERSPNDPNIFLVTHSGEHTHPCPNNHVASIARSKAKNNNNNSAPNSSSTLSPGTPLMDDETIVAQKDNVVVELGDNITTTNNNNVIVPDRGGARIFSSPGLIDTPTRLHGD